MDRITCLPKLDKPMFWAYIPIRKTSVLSYVIPLYHGAGEGSKDTEDH